MPLNLKEGIAGEVEKTVKQEDTAFNHGSVYNGILGTPALLALFEKAAQQSVLAHLPKGFMTVGLEFNIKHLKPVAVGDPIKCISVLKKVNKRYLHFEVNAYTDDKLVAKGTIIQFAVESDKFTKLLPFL